MSPARVVIQVANPHRAPASLDSREVASEPRGPAPNKTQPHDRRSVWRLSCLPDEGKSQPCPTPLLEVSDALDAQPVQRGGRGTEFLWRSRSEHEGYASAPEAESCMPPGT